MTFKAPCTPQFTVQALVYTEDRDCVYPATLTCYGSNIFAGVTTLRGKLQPRGDSPDFLRITHMKLGEGLGKWALDALERTPDGWYVRISRMVEATDPSVDPGIVQTLLRPLAMELVHARTKFPANQYLFEALAEEIGEMADAWITEGDTPHSRKEALQVACVAMRVYLEGVNREGESPATLDALKTMEPLARDFFASLAHRPDLSARSDT